MGELRDEAGGVRRGRVHIVVPRDEMHAALVKERDAAVARATKIEDDMTQLKTELFKKSGDLEMIKGASGGVAGMLDEERRRHKETIAEQRTMQLESRADCKKIKDLTRDLENAERDVRDKRRQLEWSRQMNTELTTIKSTEGGLVGMLEEEKRRHEETCERVRTLQREKAALIQTIESYRRPPRVVGTSGF